MLGRTFRATIFLRFPGKRSDRVGQTHIAKSGPGQVLSAGPSRRIAKMAMFDDASSDANDMGAAYLASLKRSIAPQAAGEAAARAGAAPPASENLAGEIPGGRPVPGTLERRRGPRYRCQGSAHLRELGNGTATWATITDISLHGCYVEATASYRVGEALALTIEANGFKVEMTAEVRIVYPRLGMGISFTEISEENRERLGELLRSLSRPSVILGSRVPPTAPARPAFGALPPVANPGAALQAINAFFEDRHILGREEFLRILRKSQGK